MNPAQSCSARCSDFTPGETIPFDPEPDLAGIGVIISFMITLIFTILITWAASVIVDLFCYKDGDEVAKFSVSSISERSRIVREKINTTAKGRKLRQACFITLTFSDQQLIIGTSLLTAAYVKHCTLTQYHFEIAGLLSLCAFRTFQLASGILAGTLRSNFSKAWRLFWVTVVASMILVTNIFRMNTYFLQPFGSPLYCLQEVLSNGRGYEGARAPRLAYTILTEVIMVYCRCCLRLFPSMYNWRLLKGLIGSLQRILLLPGKHLLEAQEKSQTWRVRFFWCLTFLSIMIRYMISSTAMELGAVVAIFVRVISLVWIARNTASAQGRRGSEDEWGFGQILPLFLLALPVTTLIESIRSPWEISSSPMPPAQERSQTETAETNTSPTPCATNKLPEKPKPNDIAGSSTAVSHTEAPSRLAIVRSLSSPELTVDKQRLRSKILDYSASSLGTLNTLEASPVLERQGNSHDPDKEWQKKVERYESTYLNRGSFQIWIFLFNIGALLLHTVIILPAQYG